MKNTTALRAFSFALPSLAGCGLFEGDCKEGDPACPASDSTSQSSGNHALGALVLSEAHAPGGNPSSSGSAGFSPNTAVAAAASNECALDTGISALAKLRHTGTVRVRDYGMTEDGQLFYVMDLVEGRDLDSVIEERGRLALGDAVCIARQVTEVLAAAQAVGITHRDVKPANIRLVGSDGHVAKLLDFGIARLDAADHTVTRWGAVVGTPSYLAPEALLHGQSDARSDVYGMAATLYHALAGHPPYGKLSLAEAVARAGKARPAPVSKWRDEPVPAELEGLLACALSPVPGERPQDCAALLRELEALPCACGCGC